MGKAAGTIERDGEIQDISIRAPKISLSGLENMRIKSSQHEFPLSEIAHVSVEYSSNSIYRKNHARMVSIGARVNQEEAYDKVVNSIENCFSQLSVPPQYKLAVLISGNIEYIGNYLPLSISSVSTKGDSGYLFRFAP